MFRFPNSRRLSCGTVILHPGREILLCHVTGQSHWDLPKGGIDPGETPLDAALRETLEETGLVLDREALVDLGQHRYTAKKDLHLYATCVPHFELAPLHCTTLFVERQGGRSLPEMDGYAWFGFDRIAAACTPTMGRLLTRELDLDRWVRTIRPAAAPPRVVPRG